MRWEPSVVGLLLVTPIELGPYQIMHMSNVGSALCVEFRVCKELCFCIVGGGICLGDFLDAPALKKEVEGRSSFLPTAPFSAEASSEKSPRANSSPCSRTWDSMIRISSFKLMVDSVSFTFKKYLFLEESYIEDEL
jgi:hypothetical protein